MHMIHRKRVFQTVKSVNQTVRQRSLTPTNSNIPGSNQSLSTRTSPQSSGLSTPHSTMFAGDISGDSVAFDNRTQSILMETASNQDREKKVSGAEDLRLALRRLSLRRQNNLSERRFFEEERERRRGGVNGALDHENVLSHSDSIMSLGNLHLWASRGPYLPDKLQIVKPLEGEGGRERGSSCKAGRSWEGEHHLGVGTKKGSKWGWVTEGERRCEGRQGRILEGERVWGWAKRTIAGVERERGRRWARDRAGDRKRRSAKEKKERPMPLMLFNSFWSLMHHHKYGSYYKEPQPRGWL
ncbi:hypothetical protein XENOCAPTIV_026706 [Xenoophorus captivus]|uniref:Trafficking kinesin-binding protein C-terminal domain-containing protein n=1 Tax=Xenoophorus captivus TaxID=1517983 RepID=A0ABV0SBM0_9TELE